MFAWRIQIVDETGNLTELIVSGLSLGRAIADLGYDSQQIVSADRCFSADWLNLNISSHKQMIFLMKLLPYYISGNPQQSTTLFSDYAPIRRLSSRYPTALDVNLSLSERLEVLRFNPVVVAIIRAGEKSSEITSVIKQAISNLQKEIEIDGKARKGVVGGLLLFIVSLVILLGVAAGTSGALESIIEVGIIERRNFAGLILSALGNYVDSYLWSLFLIAALIVGVVYKYVGSLKHLWPLSLFNDYLNVLRSIRLVSVWLILEQADLSIEHDEQLLAVAIGKKRAMQISRQIKTGETFSDLLSQQHFSAIIEECCTGISTLSASDRIHLLEQIAQLLDTEREQLATTLSRTFYISGMIIATGAIVLILSGILLPIYASGLGGVSL